MAKKAKAVVIVRPDGTEAEYPSQSAASKHEPLEQTDISVMCNKGRQVAGYRARFKEVEKESKV